MGVSLRAVLLDEQQTDKQTSNDGQEYDTFLQIWRNWQDDFPSPDPEVYERELKIQPPEPDEDDNVWLKIYKLQQITQFNFRINDFKQINQFWMWVNDAKSAHDCADLIQKYYSHDEELLDAARWLRFWADKGARFELSC